jgi:hypothetical protein
LKEGQARRGGEESCASCVGGSCSFFTVRPNSVFLPSHFSASPRISSVFFFFFFFYASWCSLFLNPHPPLETRSVVKVTPPQQALIRPSARSLVLLTNVGNGSAQLGNKLLGFSTGRVPDFRILEEFLSPVCETTRPRSDDRGLHLQYRIECSKIAHDSIERIGIGFGGRYVWSRVPFLFHLICRCKWLAICPFAASCWRGGGWESNCADRYSVPILCCRFSITTRFPSSIVL